MLIGIDGNEANVTDRVGSNTYAFELLRWFYKLDKKNTFNVYLKNKPLVDLPQENENWYNKVLKQSFLWTRWRLPLDLFFHKPRPNIFFTPGHYAPKFCPVPLAISIMDLSFLYYPEMFKTKDLYKLKKWTSEAVKKANHIFTISNFTKSDIMKSYQIPQDRITVTYPGYNKQIFNREIDKSEINAVKSKYNLKGEYILYLGTIQPRKNLVKLIRAFKESKIKNVSLVIAGKKGWHYEDILQEAKTNNVEKVVFTGYIKEDDKPALIKGSKGLVLVSLYEGFGIPVIEAMALGTPVLVSNSSSLQEITGNRGITVDPKSVKSISEGLSQVIQLNKLEKERLSVLQKKRVKMFSWKKSANKTLEKLYELAI